MSRGFVGDFTAYLKTRTDCPPAFHAHAALTALAVTLGNRVWCDGWGRPIYPNLWSVVIAPSGYGKSVPLDMGQSVLQQAGLGYAVLPDSFSQEALYDALKAQPTGIFYLQEFASFMGTLRRDYNSAAEQWLTALFDVPEVDKRLTKGGGTVELRRPCISILGASSPDWFAESFRGSSLRGGFLARFLFCPSREPGEYVGHPGPRDQGIEAGLAGHLQAAAELEGKADFSQVWRAFNDWDRCARERLRKDCPPEFSGMRSRAGLLVLKVAMLLHTSADPQSLTITPRDLDHAIRFVERAQGQAEAYLTDEVAHDRDDADRLRLMDIVRRHEGKVQWGPALKASHMSADKFKRAVDTLVQADRLQVQPIPGSKSAWIVEPVPLRAVAS